MAGKVQLDVGGNGLVFDTYNEKTDTEGVSLRLKWSSNPVVLAQRFRKAAEFLEKHKDGPLILAEL